MSNKIGILFAMKDTFPQAFIDRVNSKNEKDIIAEAVSIDKVVQNKNADYAIIIDRISQDVPFYLAYLKTRQNEFDLGDLHQGSC